ncbi:MAG: YitT family protein [Actinomycetota bacterium]|nr:YitT family protein [Actinomycetota bacterium]
MLALPPRADLGRRLLQLFPGLVLCGVGLSLMVLARLGLGPWDVLHQGMSDRTGLPIGTVVILVGFAVLLGWVPLRQRLGVGTICNVVVIGLVMDAVLALASEPRDLVARWVCLLGGVTLMGLGSGLYIGAGLGPGPRDGLMTGLAARGHSLRLVRTLIEVSALAVGWVLGGTVGVGTLVFAFGIGPLVQLFLGPLTVPTLSVGAE